jgi:hypothetical protein
MIEPRYTYCVYHGSRWMGLVEQGWVTMTVENGIAKMLWDGKRR